MEHKQLSPASGEAVLDSFREGVLTITLNRPEVANAINPDQRNTIIRLIESAGADPDVRAVVLASTGKHFCAGADVQGVKPGTQNHVGETMQRLLLGAQRLITSVLDCPKPVIASVQGAAAGMGAHLAYAADLIVASETARFIESFVTRGLVVDTAGAYLLPRRIGIQRAKELALLGEPLSAIEARGLGLVNRVVPLDDLVPATAELAGRLAVLPTTALSMTKRLLNSSLDQSRSDSLLAEAMAQELNGHSLDAAEGIAAFKEHRQPEYRGF
ncbi:MAG: putative enoyl-CoA hydratase [Subtercola sp.]|nr:putative enoyl-CoA hydratase [Subtercola sp.]